ncbi:MAG: sensor domain-containing diguanylate cyclase [Pseudomonadota bacterium]
MGNDKLTLLNSNMDIHSIGNQTNTNLLQVILESSPNIIIFALDTNYNYLAFNQEHKKMMEILWGKEIELGMNMLEVIGREDDCQKAKQLFDKALACNSFVDETEYGDELLSRKFWWTYYSPIYDETEKKAIGLTCFNLDISKRRNTEILLAKTASELSTLIDAIPDLVWMKDIKGVYIASNPALDRFFNVNHGELIGKTDYDLMNKHNAEICQITDEDVMASGKINISEEVVTDHNGTQNVFEIRKVPIYDVDQRMIGSIGIGTDVTERKKTEEKLKLLASVFTSAKEGIVITNTSGIIVDVNEAYALITGYSKDEIIGQNAGFLKSEKHGKAFYKHMWEELIRNKYWIGEIWNRRKNGEIFVERLTISAICDSNENISSYVGLLTDITMGKDYESNLERMAFYDSLTGLPNRLLLSERTHQAMSLSKRFNSMMAVCYLDLDEFKPVNDNYGHSTGDALLIEIGHRMQKCVRESDTVARIGGDEFAILLLNINTKKECENIIIKLLESINKSYTLPNNEHIKVGASIGITLYPQDDDTTAEVLLRHADQAMYLAKETGKNKYVFHSQSLQSD